MTAEIIYTGDLRTHATHVQSGQTLITDAPIDNQGKGEAFSPTDLCATSLACCILTIMGIKAKESQIDMTGTKVAVNKIMTVEPPRRIARIELLMSMPDKIWTDEEKQILTQAASSCPVCRSLNPVIETNLTITWP
jgi:putative redox protein